MKDAAIGGLTEVALGKVAVEKGLSNAVKEFGQKMIDDHTKANEEADPRADTPTPVDTATRVDRAFPAVAGGVILAAVDAATPADKPFRADAVTLVAAAAIRAVGGTPVDVFTPAGAVITVADEVTTAGAATTEDVAGAAMGITGVAIWDSTPLPTPTEAITTRAITPLAIATRSVITINGVTGSRIQVAPSTLAIIRAIQPIRAINLS